MTSPSNGQSGISVDGLMFLHQWKDKFSFDSNTAWYCDNLCDIKAGRVVMLNVDSIWCGEYTLSSPPNTKFEDFLTMMFAVPISLRNAGILQITESRLVLYYATGLNLFPRVCMSTWQFLYLYG